MLGILIVCIMGHGILELVPLLTFCGTFSNKVRCLKQDKARDRIVLLIKLCTLSVQPKRDESSDRDAFFFFWCFCIRINRLSANFNTVFKCDFIINLLSHIRSVPEIDGDL